ncbi:glycosyltransferase, partial [bacterium]|nr:glycosyltransferase [bacterium]
SEQFELLYLGSLAHRRGVKEVVEALAADASIREGLVLRIVGGGPGESEIRHLVKSAGLGETVRFEGSVPPEKVPAILRKADAFISPLPDHKWWRVSSPLKLFEYLATGKPMLLTDIPPHRDVVSRDLPGIVWLADLSAGQIARGLDEMRRRHAEFAASAQERRDLASRHTWARQAEILAEFLCETYGVL